jgi:hypothetical protein
MVSKTISAQDKKWAAESDARTLAEAEAIRKDVSRMRAASKEAKKMVDEEMIKAKALRKVSGMKPLKK